MEFITRAGIGAGDKARPDSCAGGFEGVDLAIPTIEVADNGNALCVRSPNGELSASANLLMVRAQEGGKASVSAIEKTREIGLADGASGCGHGVGGDARNYAIRSRMPRRGMRTHPGRLLSS